MEKKLLFLLFIVSLFMCTQAEATVLTYNGWAGNNYNIADYYDTGGNNYGSRISSSPVAYHEDTDASDISAVFTVGNGWTPNIELTWISSSWDTYTGWRGHEVAQIDGSSPGNPRDLVFTPDAGYGVLINSFDLDEWAGGGGCVVDWKVSDATGTLASGTWIGNTAGTRSTVSTGLTIDDMTIDNVVTLSFEQTAGDATYLAMDDTNFDQFGGANATNPSPANKATDVPRDVVLSWTPGIFASQINGHKVYLSESLNDVNDGIGAITQSAGNYAPPQRLDFNTTYYWRVDEVNAPPDSTVHQGDVWNFTTEPFAYPIAGEKITATASSTNQEGMEPENTINGSGLDANDLHSMEPTDMWLSGDEPLGAWCEYELDKVHKLHQMWVWNSNQVMESLIGFGLKDVTIEYSTNGIDWTGLAGVPEFARAPGADGYEHNTTVDFGSTAAKYVRLTANSNWGGVLKQYGLSEVRFFHIPVHATEPYPDSGTADVDIDVVLGFRTGREAVTHNVYLSTDEQAVIDSNAPVTTVTEASYGPLSLELDTTYYWKINEVNETESPATWESDLWSFTTTDHLIVDDFENYNDYPPNEIWSTWVDGYGVSANSGTSGYPDPDFLAGEHYMETTIVHGGDQSMPFFYSNTGGATYSEGERTFAVPQDWTKAGIQALVLYFRGTVGNTGQMYVKINGSKIPYDGAAGNIALIGWQLWNIDLTSSGLNLQSLSSLAIGIDGNGASGTLYFDDIGLYVSAPPPINEWRIADGADDVEEAVAAGGIDMTSSDLELPYENTGQGNPQIIGLRFTGIPIPNGATITEAWVRFKVDETKGGTEAVNLIIEGELSLDAAEFTDSEAFNVSSRPTTTAQVQWAVPNWTTVGDQGPDQTTPSIASIIQEIVNQNGWSGGTIVLIFRDNPANPSLGIRCAGAGSGAVVLHISYQ